MDGRARRRRGFMQAELARLGGGGWTIFAISASAVLFGLAHFGGGATYVVAATLAGLGYALAYHRTQRIETAMAVHFGLRNPAMTPADSTKTRAPSRTVKSSSTAVPVCGSNAISV